MTKPPSTDKKKPITAKRTKKRGETSRQAQDPISHLLVRIGYEHMAGPELKITIGGPTQKPAWKDEASGERQLAAYPLDKLFTKPGRERFELVMQLLRNIDQGSKTTPFEVGLMSFADACLRLGAKIALEDHELGARIAYPRLERKKRKKLEINLKVGNINTKTK